MNNIMILLWLFCLGTKHCQIILKPYYIKPILQGCINIRTTHNGKVYWITEKSHSLKQMASSPLRIQQDTANLLTSDARRPWRPTWSIYEMFDLVKRIRTNIWIIIWNVFSVASCYVSSILHLKLKKGT